MVQKRTLCDHERRISDMLSHLLVERKYTIQSLIEAIDDTLTEMKLHAVVEEEKEMKERFVSFCQYVQQYMKEYTAKMDEFLSEAGLGFTFADYQKAFEEKDQEVRFLLNEYMYFKSRMMG